MTALATFRWRMSSYVPVESVSYVPAASEFRQVVYISDASYDDVEMIDEDACDTVVSGQRVSLIDGDEHALADTDVDLAFYHDTHLEDDGAEFHSNGGFV